MGQHGDELIVQDSATTERSKFDVWTIGHGGRSPSALVSALAPLSIEWIVDVRSSPYSRYQPEFNREPLSAILERVDGPDYLFLGDVLGGRPDDASCYVDGLVDYDACRARDWFIEGMARLERGIDGHRIALLCSESKPESCHRTKLIGVELEKRGYSVGHVDERGEQIAQQDAINRITHGQQSLFSDVSLQTSRARYASDGSSLR